MPPCIPWMWQCHLPVFLSWDHGSSCLCQHMTSVLIVCLVFFKFLPRLKQVSLVRSFPSSLQSTSQSLGHFFPRNPNFPSHYTGYLGRCCPPDVELAGLASWVYTVKPSASHWLEMRSNDFFLKACLSFSGSWWITASLDWISSHQPIIPISLQGPGPFMRSHVVGVLGFIALRY